MLALPATKLIEIGCATFEYVTAGVGKPAVVLINGSGGPIEGWHRVFSALSNKTTTFAYNRPGVGKSTDPLRPQTAVAMVEDLRTLLLAVSIPQPWVLVGHSFGGLVANLFARLHPNDICGVVMLEATAPDDVCKLKPFESTVQRGLAWVANRLWPLNLNHETIHASQSVSEIECAPAFPPLPLRVLTGTKPTMAWATNSMMLALRAKHQASLAALSPLGFQFQASRSGHFPQFTEPDLVIMATQELIAAAN
jgi:pimeloyl-ACP methyl ester carboxylesterase